MECILRVSGTHFQPDEFLKTSPLVAATLWRKGEMRMRVNGNVPHDDSGINISIAKADALTNQIEDVVRFLISNKPELARLRAFVGVECLVLDFGIALRDDLATRTDHLPLELLKLCGESGLEIDLSHYQVSTQP